MTTATEAFDVIILGAGAAGLMCALTAGQRGRKVLLLDHADKVGAKILISGGGRCNFTNLHSAPDRFLSGNPDFCRSALGRYTQADFIALVERHRHPLSREDTRPIVLRWLGARHRRHAAGRMRARRRRCQGRPHRHGYFPCRQLPRGDQPNGMLHRVRRLCWRRAACRSRKWARPASPMTSRGASA